MEIIDLRVHMNLRSYKKKYKVFATKSSKKKKKLFCPATGSGLAASSVILAFLWLFQMDLTNPKIKIQAQLNPKLPCIRCEEYLKLDFVIVKEHNIIFLVFCLNHFFEFSRSKKKNGYYWLKPKIDQLHDYK